MQPVTSYVTKVVLRPQQDISFAPGQYLQVVMSDDDKRPFSIASSANEPELHLHIGAVPENPYAMEVLELCRTQPQIQIEVPCGTAAWQPSPGAHNILLAGGTGYSYARSILFSALADKVADEQFTLYWGAKTAQDLYEYGQLSQLSQQHGNFAFVPVVEQPDDGWDGRTGLVHEAVLEDFATFSKERVYVAGRFEMAKVVKDVFSAAGLPPAQLIGDAFAYIG